MTLRKWDFLAYFFVVISFGSLTGLAIDHPYAWVFFSFIIAYAMAKQP